MYVFETSLEAGAGPMRVLLVHAHATERIADVLERLRIHKGWIEADAVVVRAPVETIWDGEGYGVDARQPLTKHIERVLGEPEGVYRRASDRSVHVLSTFRGAPFVTANLNALVESDPIFGSGLDEAAVLDRLRESEMAHLVSRSKALLSAPPNSVFRAPSGHLVGHFVRVGNIQSDRDALDAIAFWMLPHLNGIDAVLLDTWSISSVALHAVRLAERHYGRGPIPVEMLHGYNDGSDDAKDRAAESIARLGNEVSEDAAVPNVLVLISATQSGSLSGRLAAAFENAPRPMTPRYLALFALRESDLPRLANLTADPRFSLKEDGDDADMSVLGIDPQVYFPLVYTDVPIRLVRNDAQRSRGFFDRYASSGLVRLHVDDGRGSGTGRHHAIHLDLAAVLDRETFAEQLREKLAGMGPQRAILRPEHRAAEGLATKVAELLGEAGEAPQVLSTTGLNSMARGETRASLHDLLAECGDQDEIVVVDDVVVTTASLAQIDKQLRTLRFKGRVNYVVGIQRMPSTAEWKGFSRRLMQRGEAPPNTILCVEEVVLPDVDEDGCPWCREQKLYDGWLAEGLDLPAALRDRRSVLANSETGGLQDDAFLHQSDMPTPKLGPGSFYVRDPCTQADVFAALSAALQILRTQTGLKAALLGPRHYPLATVLHHEDYLLQKWTDTVIRAAILRAASCDELVWTAPDRERERTQAFEQIIHHASPNEHDLMLEIILAAHLGKAGVHHSDASIRLLAKRRDRSGAATFLLDRLRQAAPPSAGQPGPQPTKKSLLRGRFTLAIGAIAATAVVAATLKRPWHVKWWNARSEAEPR